MGIEWDIYYNDALNEPKRTRWTKTLFVSWVQLDREHEDVIRCDAMYIYYENYQSNYKYYVV